MLIKKHLLLSAFLILVSGFFILSLPQTANAGLIPISNCCIDHGGLGCDDLTCEDTVCSQDPFCCDIAWDSICAAQANDLCEVCNRIQPVRNVPTMSEWGLIAFAGILGLVGFFYIFTRRKRAAS